MSEPVAWQWLDSGHFRKKLPATAETGAWRPLYTHPPIERTLTDEKIAELWHLNGGFHHHFARAVERYLKGEK
jgi:hypothetical protein